jgi:membrane fusion protein (multidrug efflux system)
MSTARRSSTTAGRGLGAGTGAAFALLPAQNATGNWIKVVQRVPVRIALEPAEVAAHPLRIGLSMDAKVDVRDTGGRMLADGSRPAAQAKTASFDEGRAAADADVQRIIAANLGRPLAAVAATLGEPRGDCRRRSPAGPGARVFVRRGALMSATAARAGRTGAAAFRSRSPARPQRLPATRRRRR